MPGSSGQPVRQRPEGRPSGGYDCGAATRPLGDPHRRTALHAAPATVDVVRIVLFDEQTRYAAERVHQALNRVGDTHGGDQHASTRLTGKIVAAALVLLPTEHPRSA